MIFFVQGKGEGGKLLRWARRKRSVTRRWEERGKKKSAFISTRDRGGGSRSSRLRGVGWGEAPQTVTGGGESETFLRRESSLIWRLGEEKRKRNNQSSSRKERKGEKDCSPLDTRKAGWVERERKRAVYPSSRIWEKEKKRGEES